MPLVDNETPENRAINRRVEIILIQGEMPQKLNNPILDIMREQQ